MIGFASLQLLIAAIVVVVAGRRAYEIFVRAPLDARLFIAEVRRALGREEPEAIVELARGAPDAWLARVAEEGAHDVERAQELVGDLRIESMRGLLALRSLGTVASLLGLMGAILQAIQVLSGERGLEGLVAGLAERMAMQRATTSMAIGLATALFAFYARMQLREAGRNLIGEAERCVDVLRRHARDDEPPETAKPA